MARFHINKHGVPAPCRAKPGNCPLGGDEQHYNSQEEAQEAADIANEGEHGLLKGLQKSKGFDPNSSEYKDKRLDYREADITLTDGSMVEGYIYKIDEDNELILLNGPDGQERINFEDVSEIDISEEAYFSQKHKEALREQEKPQVKFRYSEEDLDNLKGGFVKVEYDGKKFDGEIVETHFNSRHDNGIIIQSEDGSIKHIKNYRLEDVELTGNSWNEHKSYKEIENINDYIYNYEIESDSRTPETSETTMSEQVNKYFEAVVAKHNGEDIDLENLAVDLSNQWSEDVEDNRDAYYDTGPSYYHYHDGGGQHADWTSRSDEWMDEDLYIADEAGDHFYEKTEMIDEVYNKVNNIDWTKYGKEQKQGVSDALEHIFSTDSINEY